MKNAKMRETFESMQAAMTAHNAELERILEKFSRDTAAAEKKYQPYKESERLTRDAIRELIPDVRANILNLSGELSKALHDGSRAMYETLQERLCKPVPDAFMRQLRAYADNGIVPGKAEIEALLLLNNGNLLGFRILKETLSKEGCPFTFEFRNVNEFETDIKMLREFAERTAYNPTFDTAHAAEVAKIFAEYGRKQEFEPAEHGDSLKTEIISAAFPIRDNKGGESGIVWSIDTLSAVAGQHGFIMQQLEKIRPVWEEPDIFPEVTGDPTATVRELSAQQAQTSARAGEIIAQYAE